MACTISRVAAKLPADRIVLKETAYEFSQARRWYVAQRSSQLLRDYQTQAAEAAQGGAHGGLDHHKCRGMGPDADHAARRAHASCRWFTDARYSELVLA